MVISVPHPLAPVTLRQHEMAWYQLFFQFAGVAEATIKADDWAWLRMFSRGDGDVGQWIEELSRPGALTAAVCRARGAAGTARHSMRTGRQSDIDPFRDGKP